MGIQRARSRKRDALASTSSLPAATPHLQLAAVAAHPIPVPTISATPSTQALPQPLTKQEEAAADLVTKDVSDKANKVRLEKI